MKTHQSVLYRDDRFAVTPIKNKTVERNDIAIIVGSELQPPNLREDIKNSLQMPKVDGMNISLRIAHSTS